VSEIEVKKERSPAQKAHDERLAQMSAERRAKQAARATQGNDEGKDGAPLAVREKDAQELRGEQRADLREAPRPNGQLTADDFGYSPYHGQIEALKAKAREELKRRQAEAAATKPWDSREAVSRRNLFKVGDVAALQDLKNRGLEICWINEVHEAQQYLDQGYRLARMSDVKAGFRDMAAQDSGSVDTIIRRKEMVAVIGPIKWREERIQAEEHLAHQQLGKQQAEDEALGLIGELPREPGRFGRTKRRPRLDGQLQREVED